MGLFSSIVKGVTGIVTGNPAAAIGAVTDLGGTLLTNSANKSAAAKQMAYQTGMSNTSYQRGVEDMKAAGINPALAYSQGGASVPSGSQANVESYGGIGSKAITNAAQVANVGLTKAQTNSVDVTAAKTLVDRQNALVDNAIKQQEVASNKLDLEAKNSLSPKARAYIGALGQLTSSAKDVANIVKP